jgi:choice-of-anchor C domain-containing protein
VSNEFENLAQTAANVLVSAIAADTWAAAKHAFAAIVGRERQIDDTRRVLAIRSGPDLARAQAELAQRWVTRLRDFLDENPGAAADLQALLARFGAASGPAITTVAQHADRRSTAGSVGGDVRGNTGDVYVGVRKVDKRRFRFSPLLFFGHAAKAHPLVASAVTVVTIGGLTGGLALTHGALPANLVLNGGFTEPACSSVCEVGARSTEIPHWTVGGNSVDIIPSGYFEPAAGSQSVDLSGGAPGTLTQTVTTAAGSTYLLRWHMAGNPVCGQQFKTMDVYWDGVLEDTFKFSTSGHTVKSMGWVTRQITVTANSSASSIKFADATPDHSQCGATLDEVSLVRT